MIKTAELMSGTSTAAIDKIHELLHQQELGDVTSLQLYVWLHRLGKLTDHLRGCLVKQANVDFKNLAKAQPKMNSWKPVDFAALQRMPKPSSWAYPAELVTEEAKLKAKKEAAKTDKTAVHSVGKINTDTNALFKVSLFEC